jgi:hypothetical protein
VASIAAGADGLLIEVHPDPPNALSDGAQSLDCAAFAELMRRLAPVAEFAGRRLPKRNVAVDGAAGTSAYRPLPEKSDNASNPASAVRSSRRGVRLA